MGYYSCMEHLTDHRVADEAEILLRFDLDLGIPKVASVILKASSDTTFSGSDPRTFTVRCSAPEAHFLCRILCSALETLADFSVLQA